MTSGDARTAARRIITPIGELTVNASARGVTAVVLPGMSVPSAGGVAPVVVDDRRAGAICDAATAQLEEYFAGTRCDFDVALDLVGTSFQLLAWRALMRIPYGVRATYGEQATMMGRPGAARAVGAANGSNPVPIIVPCHRVVGSDGRLVGYAARALGDAGLAMKEWLLSHEDAVRACGVRGGAGTVGS